jgi:ubiquinone/menaquinone biosynthesis C-methylase UbiE
MDADEFYKIQELEHEHWWYRSLHELTLKNIIKHFDNKNIKIIDACCGTGGLLEFLSLNGYNNTEGFDISEPGINIAKQKKLNVINADLKYISDYYNDNYADVIICNDALYFFNSIDQKVIINKMNNILKPDGILILNLPALKAFAGVHDIIVNITKRINKREFKNLIVNSQFSILNSIYWPFILSIPIWVKRFIQRIKMKFNKNLIIKSDLKKEPYLLNKLLYLIASFENKHYSWKPFGSSLFIVLHKI